MVAAGGPDQSWSSWAWTSGNYGVHFGYMVPWWARILWFAAGLVSIYLVGSGFWTWWWRRRQVRKRTYERAAHLASGSQRGRWVVAIPARSSASMPDGRATNSGGSRQA